MLKSKKGVSPLIATVLLIAFAVALGAVVMNWGRSYVEDTANFAREKSDLEVKCSTDVRIEFLRIKDTKRICYYDGDSSNLDYLNFTIQNTGTAEVKGIEINVIGGRDVNISQVDMNLSRAKLYRNDELGYTTGSDGVGEDGGEPLQIKIIPQINVGGAVTSCPANALVKEDLEVC